MFDQAGIICCQAGILSTVVPECCSVPSSGPSANVVGEAEEEDGGEEESESLPRTLHCTSRGACRLAFLLSRCTPSAPVPPNAIAHRVRCRSVQASRLKAPQQDTAATAQPVSTYLSVVCLALFCGGSTRCCCNERPTLGMCECLKECPEVAEWIELLAAGVANSNANPDI